MKLTYMESQFQLPNGKYHARFLGVTMVEAKPGEKPRLGKDGNPLPPAMTWNFEVVDGPETGKRSDKMTGRVATPGSGCGKLLLAITDRVLEDGEEVDLDPFVGKVYRITVVDNRISDNPAPVMVHGYQPSAATTSFVTTRNNSVVDPNARWDMSDGATMTVNQTTAEVQQFLDSSGCPLEKIRLRVTGTSGPIKTADQWGFAVAQPAAATSMGDPIPF